FELVQRLRPRVARWLVFHRAEPTTSEKWVRLVRRRLAKHDPASLVGAGTDAYFTELNRGRPPVANLDFISFSINPQIHAIDLLSLAENLESLGAVLDSARVIANGRPISVSPVTLRPRRNVVATGPVVEPPPGELPEAVDPRQMSLFGAAWTLGCLKRLAEGGAAWTTWYETSGWRGVLETERGSPLPSRFRSLPGSVFPLYHVLHAVGGFAGGSVLPSQSSAPLEVECMALEAGARRAIIVSSLTSEPRRVTADWPSGEAHVKRLGEENAERAMLEPEAYSAEPGEVLRASGGRIALELGPYETVWMES
ncbi:MAG TPA: hypothetical protein VMT52_00780, partial [Planctomycetota bacterium]|nr:hypothetical protein [Planctomycetota bacterium]